MEDDHNQAILLRAIEHLNNPPTRDEYFHLYAPNAVLHRTPALPPGLENIKHYYRTLWSAFPDMRLTVKALTRSAGMVACAFDVDATHKSTFLGIPATARPVHYGGVTLLRFERGQCVERWSQSDLFSLLQQIGAIPKFV